MAWLNDFLVWAWERHHNVLSWYIRPLFLLPFCYFAYKRSFTGILVTLFALATSMFWFPKPAQPDPQVIAFLAMEKRYLTSAWTLPMTFMAALVPLSLGALALAFWKRSFLYGLLLINAMVGTKLFWSFAYGATDGAQALLLPALLGMVICNVVIVFAVRFIHNRRIMQPEHA